MSNIRYYFSSQAGVKKYFNKWDLLTLLITLSILFGMAWSAHQMAVPYQIGQALPINLNPSYLPGYAARTVLRMFIALFFSLLFTLTIGTWAAKSKRAAQIIIPAIDILQSVPVLSFLSITIVSFIHLFPGKLLGPECAAIFVIFTAQAWNMSLGFYQALRSVPLDLQETAAVFHLSPWQKFWRIEVPFSAPSLLWNTMMSMSASWFFVVLSEAISVSNQQIRLPGVGSYISIAIEQADKTAVGYAILTMLVVILLYDQLLFRPLVKWSDKFKLEQTAGELSPGSWVVRLFHKTRLFYYAGDILNWLGDRFLNNKFFNFKLPKSTTEVHHPSKIGNWIFNTAVFIGIVIFSIIVIRFILTTLSAHEIVHVFLLGSVTALRVIVLIVFSSLIWIPIGVWIGMRPRVSQFSQPIIQFLAAFPANLIYPLVVIAIVWYRLNVEIWLSPLMILGTQWYILFNVIAGASQIPRDLYQAAANLGVNGWQWWRRLALPGIFPYYITGAITAAGGAWNASIVAEWVSWGNTTLRATGLGDYIHASTNMGNFQRIALGTSVMCVFVLLFNYCVWRPLYRLAENRYRLS